MRTLKCPQSGAGIVSVLATYGVRATSGASAEAARQNAKRGGWPMGRARKKPPRMIRQLLPSASIRLDAVPRGLPPVDAPIWSIKS